ncbi:uncharacterized protein LOC131180938 [Hevea brasiliensis]|uniref:uncharacterized protein LOC131180938 n=1 Tax=Hevea brasiliensis TaxID=3981 RepID=UPI0025E0E655|nr:uncharacterized protein LOC131180938 [Hevea brasiliensis]
MYGSVDVSSLRLVPDVVVPPKFKVPNFDKYTRNLDPRIHLATYIAKMSALTEDDRLLVHFFHKSLFGAILRWWYDTNAQCEYHGGALGHSTDNCGALRGRVQALIKNGWLKIEGNSSLPNVTSNPLPNHGTGNGVNMIEPQDENSILEVDRLIPHFEKIFAMAVREGYLCPQTSGSESDTGCPYHVGATDHELQNCEEFRQEVRRMLSLKTLRCQRKPRLEGEVNIARFGRNASTPNPRLTFSALSIPTPTPPITVIRTPPQLPVTNTHAVPWNYNLQVFTQEASSSTSAPTLNYTHTQPITPPKPCFAPHEHFKMTFAGPSKNATPQSNPKPVTTTDSLPQDQEIEFITQSGRCYGNNVREKKKGKVKMGEPQENTEDGAVRVEKGEPAEPKEEEELFVTFSKDEIDPTGLKHTKALHVTVKCKWCIVAKVLIDNRSALNVLPNATLARLPVDSSAIRQSAMVVRAFDDTKREVLGDIDLPLQIGACTFNITFQVMDIEPAYTMLLGRPWIHSANAVPSTLHQRIKYIICGKIIAVRGEEAMLVTKPQSVPYVETTERSLESSFQALEL